MLLRKEMVTGYYVVGTSSYIIPQTHLPYYVSTDTTCQLSYLRTALEQNRRCWWSARKKHLQIEHLNRVAKECIAHLHAGKTLNTIRKSNRYHCPCSWQVWCAMKTPPETHRPRAQEKDRNIILLQHEVFTSIPKRAHHPFPKSQNCEN